MKIKNLKKTFALATSALALTAAFVGCSDYSEFTAAELKQEMTENAYDEAFIKMFGHPDPNHDWGFTEVGVLQSLKGGVKQGITRAGIIPDADKSTESAILVNRNQWTDRDIKTATSGAKYIEYKNGALANDIQIPGWPHLNGLYYGSNGEGVLRYTVTKEELIAENAVREEKNNNLHDLRPVGDLTEYEIQYVSHWFRTHSKDEIPQENIAKLHLSDFFIQNVSCDQDQLSYNETPKSNQSKWWNGNNGHNKGFNVTYGLDQLGFQDLNGKWTHVNDFNANNTNFNPEESNENSYRTIQYVTSSGTEGFRCWPSWSTESNDWLDEEGKDWILVHLTWEEKTVNPAVPSEFLGTYKREGYYLAFDFSGQNGSHTYEGDGYFSNWIIKITPGRFNPSNPNVKRVMCEDLGGSNDFDFNDVVFDVGFDTNGKSIIVVQAAGGTMPIMIDKNPEETGKDNSSYEIHKLMGSDRMNPINVKQDGEQHEVAIFRGSTTSGNLKDIKFYVKNTVNGDSKWHPYSCGTNGYVNLDNLSSFNNKTEKAPRAFAIPLKVRPVVVNDDDQDQGAETEVQWMQEGQNIVNTYVYFDDWVNKKDINIGTQGGTSNRGWWEQAEVPEKLFAKVIHTSGLAGEDTPVPSVWIPLMLPDDINSHHAYSNYHLVIDREGAANEYTGQDKIFNVFNTSGATQCTFTIVLESTTQQNIEAILIPATITTDGGTTSMTYKSSDPFLTYSSEDEFKQNAFGDENHKTPVFTRWHTADLQNGFENGMRNGKYIYTVRFSFSKDQLVESYKDDGKINKMCEYLLLYLKAGNISGVSIPTLAASDSGVVEWYIHY